jgi:pyridoxal biosynthesis lyase PdxS
MLLEDMPEPVMLMPGTLGSVLAVHMVTRWRGPRAARRVLQVAQVIGMAAATGEAVTGEVVIGIRHMDILRLDITAWDTAIRTTDIIRGDTILTGTDTGRT